MNQRRTQPLTYTILNATNTYNISTLTESLSWVDGLTVDPHIQGLSQEVLQSRYGINRMRLRVDIDGVGRNMVATPGLKLAVLVVTWRELERVLRVGHDHLVVDGANGHIKQTCP